MGRPPGKIKTFPRVVELLTAAVKEKGQKTIEAETKLSQSMISRYLRGEGEPAQATLEMLAAYFKVSVAWLRGDVETDRQKRVLDKIEEMTGEEMTMMVIKSLFTGKKEALEELKKVGFTDEEAEIFIESISNHFRKELLQNMLEDLHISIFKPIIDETLKMSLDMTTKNEKKLATLLKSVGSNLELEVLNPLLKELALIPVSELPGIAAIIKRFRENEAFNLEARKLLNNSIAHSK